MILKRYNVWIACWVFVGSFILTLEFAKAQNEPLSAHYYLNPLSLNPGFTGFQNTLAFDLSSRQQWLGIKGAPSSYYLSVHSPINNSKISLGAYLHRWQVGPLSYNHLSLDYSYIARLGDRMLLSLGVELGVTNERLAYQDLFVEDSGDPNFEKPLYNQLMPSVGLGAVLFTPVFYVALSRPSITLASINLGGESDLKPQVLSHYYAICGVTAPTWHKLVAKVSVLARFVDKGGLVMDNTLQLYYNNLIGVGFTYRTQNSTSFMVHLQVNRSFGFTYSYDYALPASNIINQGSHELTLSFDYYKFYRKNKYRLFKRKKEIVDENITSIRYF